MEAAGDISDNGNIELVSEDPYFEGIPSKQRSRIVEERSYDEFAVFSAQGDLSESPDLPNSWKQQLLSKKPSEYRGQWKVASLDARTGKVELSADQSILDPSNWIKGYLFRITKDNHALSENDKQATKDLRALPSNASTAGKTTR